ncbi:MAG: transglycosylase domain-containing protein, partial [Solobacterium sp.]|nr:transglycosylase domain-containing protein [Solobacterium sp.]
MQKKKVKAKKKVDKTNVAAIIVSVIALLGLTAVLAGCVLIVTMLKDKPQLSLDDFNNAESSIILDRNGEQISELGTVLRQNVEYEDLPTSLIDAFVAVEDSRFFSHNGFDIPRFVQAIFSNLKTMSFSQGGSTFTMQLIKNTYFVDDEAGQGAAKSVERKVQEIALALELETKSTKKDIFINYLNKINFGGTSQNIRGVQKASQYYYGKDVSELNLPESAMLAGVINSPYLFNPFNYLEYAQERRDEVLYLMHYHGYISDSEYAWALSTKVEDFLYNSSENHRGANEGIPYQAYVDAVVEEVYDVTGLDPYTTPMVITTCMDKNVQQLMDKIQAGEVDGYFEYPDDEFEVASICVNNSTGEIAGILGGRNYADGGALLLNHATEQYKQPGSSIKPILDYVQAFEVLGWSTSHVITDQPTTYIGTDYIIANSTNTYAGDVTL